MKIVCLSDTHTHHRAIKVPPGDILIHAGDICHKGKSEAVIQDFNEWLGELPHPHKVLIAGNHDILFEKAPEKTRKLISNGLYLEDSGTEIEGLKIWGSPITPYFLGMGFNRKRGAEIRSHWEKIPPNLDILITHSPPRKILDRTIIGIRSGCKDLAEMLPKLAPRLHVFGHIHERHGQYSSPQTHFVNACMVNVFKKPVHSPIVIDWNHL